ncbi:MAG: MBL fold metallo-hydrolase [Hyphomicrobiales bacterium]|nr:MBL fold metallo-hydrolase [Hyphomicrobiales bacterium]MBV8663863.1 MBL fold metallo-hydrolase [Hyphomicrobiales bacterium]
MSTLPPPSFFKLSPRQPPFNGGPGEAIVVSDGELECGSVASEFPSIPKIEVNELLGPLAIARGPHFLDENCLVLRLGGRTILFDAGMGASPLLGQRAGRLLDSLAAAGVSAAAVDAIVLTHLHCDHAWGLINARGAPNFPNAQVFLSKVEFDAWMVEARPSGASAGSLEDVQAMRDCLAPYRDRLSFVADGEAFLDGVIPVATPGHTSGHMSYRIETAGFRLFNIGDVCHLHAIQFARPRWPFRWDGDPDAAVHSRLAAFGMAADEDLQVIGFHLPFPGVGRIERQGDGFRFLPASAA